MQRDPIAQSAALSRVDLGGAELLVGRLRATSAVLRDAAGVLRRSLPVDWAGAGKRAADAAVGAVVLRLERLLSAVEAIALAVAALAAALRSLQAEAAVARRVLGAEGVADVHPVVAGRLHQAIGVVQQADIRAAELIRDAFLGGALGRSRWTWSPSVAALGLTARAERIRRAGSTIAPQPQAPAAVALWWAGLSEDARAAVISSWSWLPVGLDGVPTGVRDAINRRRLAQALQAARDDLRRQRGKSSGLGHGLTVAASQVLPWPLSLPLSLLDAHQQGGVNGAQRRVAALERISAVLRRPGTELLTFSASGDGLAVVASGDPETSHDLAVLVPGMNTELEDAPKLVDEGDRLAAAAGGGTVVISWLGYDAPDLPQVISDASAKEGAGRLRRFAAGLRATAGRRQHLTVVGHSYGTLVGGIAAKRGLDTDELVLLASPGVEASSVRQLRVPAGHVWAARAATDPIAAVFLPSKLGKLVGIPLPQWYGPDPASAGFGARHFGVGGAFGHSGYFNGGSESLANLGRIVSARPVPP